MTCLMISTGEVSREQAIEALKLPPADPKLMEDDKEYVIKKLVISEEGFNEIMTAPIKNILDYPNHHGLEMKFRRLLQKLRGMKILPN